MPPKIKGQTRIVKDDDVGRIYSRGHIDQVIKHGITLRDLPSTNNVSSGRNHANNSSNRAPNNADRSLGTSRQGQGRSNNPQPGSSRQQSKNEEDCPIKVCQCDDVVKQMCLRGTIPFCNCEKRNNDGSPSILNIQLPEFSTHGRTTIGSKFYRNGERGTSTRRNEESTTAPTKQNESSQSQRPQFLDRHGSSPDLGQREFPKAGHTTKFRGHEPEGLNNRGPRSTVGSGPNFDEFHYLMGGFNPFAENPNPSPSTTAFAYPSSTPLPVRTTNSLDDFNNNIMNRADNTNGGDTIADPLRRQVTLESLNNMKLFSLYKNSSTNSPSCCIFCKMGFYLVILALLCLLISTLRHWDKDSLCKHCFKKFSDRFSGVFI